VTALTVAVIVAVAIFVHLLRCRLLQWLQPIRWGTASVLLQRWELFTMFMALFYHDIFFLWRYVFLWGILCVGWGLLV
jgi:hypothetical protein